MEKIGENKKVLTFFKNKMENNEFKKVCIKNATCYYFDNLIKLEDSNTNNILTDKST